jgi:PAS domain S-box-containing protein
MEPAASLPLAIALLAVGAILLGLTVVGLRWFAARRPVPHVASPVRLPVEHQPADTGVLVVQAGGRVLFVNDRAKQFFGLDGEDPNLWRMAQRARPADTFLELFVTEGRASLSIGDRQVDATSLRVPEDEYGPSRFVILIRETGQQPEFTVADERTASAMTIIADIGRAMTASLDLPETYEAILAHIGRAFQYNVAEMNLWDENAQVLRPVKYAGERVYEREFARAGEFFYRPGEGFSGWIAVHRQSLLISNVEASAELRPKLEHADFPVRSYLGVPLLNGPHFLGTLELVSYKANVYQPGDLALLEALAAQAALAIHNAKRFAEEQRRVAELSGLAEITRALEATADPRELFGRLSADLARLMGMQMVGFLLYREAENALVGQPHFYGVPDIVAEFYRIPLTPGSAVERIWRDEPYWLSNNVAADPMVDEAGLRQLAETAGVTATLMAPVVAGGRRLGVVQVSNKVDGTPFTEDDVRLFQIFAGQAAAILDNARLVGEAQTRARQAEGLAQIAAHAATGASVDEILRAAMVQAAELLRFDFGAILLLDEARGELVPHAPSLFGGLPEQAEVTRLRTDDPMFPFSVTRSRRSLFSGQAVLDRRIVGAYHDLVVQYQLESFINVPLLVSDRSLGEMLVAAQRRNAFSHADLQLLSTIASQLASAIERARLAAASDQDLQRRVDQLTALTRVGRELNQTLDLERILRLVHDEALHAARADCGTILLLDVDTLEPGERPDGAPIRIDLRIGEEELGPNLTQLEALALEAERPQRPADLPPDSPLAAHPEVRSALVVPIVVQNLVVGLIHLHRHDPAGFDDPALETATALASQTAIAVGNARRYEDERKRGELLRRRADQLAQLFQISRSVRSDMPLTVNLESIAFGLQEAVGFNIVLISVLDPQTLRLKRTASAGLPLSTFEQLQKVEQPWDNFMRVLHEEFRISQSYFIPEDKSAEALATLDTVTLAKARAKELTPGMWHSQDMLIIPLRGSGQEPVGILSLDDPRDGQRPDQSTIEIVEIFANQAALAIENDRLYQAAERRAARLLNLHHVIEQASRVADRRQLWQTMADALRREMDLDLCLIALQDAEREPLVTRGHAGETREGVDVGALAAVPQGNPLAQAMADNVPHFVPVVKDSLWAASPLLVATEITSFISAPIFSQGQPAGALFVGSRRAPTPFTNEDPDLFVILANQLGALLESARLEEDIQQGADQLAALADASRAVTATLRTEDVVRAVLEHLRRVIPYDSVTLWLRDGQRLRIAAAQGFENDAERLGLTVEIADSALFAEMARTGGGILVPDVRADARFPAGALQPTRSWLGAPLVSKGQIIGALALDKIEPHAYPPRATQVLAAFANQAAIALDNARLFDESEQRARELDQRSQRLTFLNRFSATVSATLDLHAILQQVAEQMTRLFGVDHSGVVLFDDVGEFGTVEAEYPDHGARGMRLAVAGDPLEEELFDRRAPVVVEDTDDDARLSAPLRETFQRLGIQSLLIVPFISQGQVVGSFSLDAMRAPRRFTHEEVELCQIIAAQTSVALSNARFAQELEARVAARTHDVERERERVETLLQITTELSSSLDLDRVLARALQLVTEAVNAPQGSIFLMDLQSDQLIYRAALGRSRPLPLGGEPAPFKRGEGLVGWVIKNRQPTVIGDLDHDPRWKRLASRDDRHNSALAVPLMANEDALGAMILLSPARNAFDEDQMRLVAAAANQVGAAINNAELYRLIRDQAERLGNLLRTQQVEATKSRAILEGIADGVMVADADGQIILFNAACERILDIPRAEIVGRPVTEFVGIYGKAGRKWIEAITQWSLDPAAYRPGEFLAERLELTDKRILSVHLAPVTTGEEYLGSVSVIRDITQEVEVDRLKSEFVTNVSHELRTPMTSIKGYADILLLGAAGPLNEHQSKFIEVIKHNADRLSTLVNDLLDISRMESGRAELVRRPVRMADILQMVADTLRGRIDQEKKPMTLRVDAPADLPDVWADRERLTQAVMNLGDNAFSYSPPGGTVTLQARVDEAHGEMVVEVTDTGMGIAPQEQARLFDRFYRGEQALISGMAGTGLGLPIARQLVDMHGGRVWLARSEVGKGSTFAIALPLGALEMEPA